MLVNVKEQYLSLFPMAFRGLDGQYRHTHTLQIHSAPWIYILVIVENIPSSIQCSSGSGRLHLNNTVIIFNIEELFFTIAT